MSLALVPVNDEGRHVLSRAEALNMSIDQLKNYISCTYPNLMPPETGGTYFDDKKKPGRADYVWAALNAATTASISQVRVAQQPISKQTTGSTSKTSPITQYFNTQQTSQKPPSTQYADISSQKPPSTQYADISSQKPPLTSPKPVTKVVALPAKHKVTQTVYTSILPTVVIQKKPEIPQVQPTSKPKLKLISVKEAVGLNDAFYAKNPFPIMSPEDQKLY